jgi:hypothetical protein
LEAAVRRLQRHERIGELLTAYAAACDALDADAVGALFAEDGSLVTPSALIAGRDAITEWYRSMLKGHSKHHVTNVAVAFDGFSVRSEFLALQDNGAGLGLVWGSYDDQLSSAADADTLRFATRTIAIGGRTKLGGS